MPKATIEIEAHDEQTMAHILSWFSGPDIDIEIETMLEDEGAISRSFSVEVLTDIRVRAGFLFEGPGAEELSKAKFVDRALDAMYESLQQAIYWCEGEFSYVEETETEDGYWVHDATQTKVHLISG